MLPLPGIQSQSPNACTKLSYSSKAAARAMLRWQEQEDQRRGYRAKTVVYYCPRCSMAGWPVWHIGRLWGKGRRP